MNITNKFNLPKGIVSFLQKDMSTPPQRETFRTTRLITPPRITQLTIRHWNEIETDASDCAFAILGIKVHERVEGEGDSYFTETPVTAEVGGKKISGRIDVIDTKETKKIQDYKTCSVYQYGKPPKEEWTLQQNIYRYLLFKAKGILVDKLEICAIFRDFRASEQKRKGKEYPPSPIVIINLPILPIPAVEEYIKQRALAHEAAYSLADNALPLCSEAERWATPPTFAIIKKGNKIAAKVENSYSEAFAYMTSKGFSPAVYDIVQRPGSSPRCERYCPVAKFCSQFKAMEKGEK